jgi:arylsulfatase A-like enzyme
LNILWILTTQWRAQACGYAGDPNVRTPALDALAHASLNFAQAVTPHPFGPFARAALLTGLRSPANGVVDYFDPLPENAETIAQQLGQVGYSTAFFGKWHLARRDPAASLVGEAHAKMIVPENARGGFAFWEGFESGFQLNRPWLHGTRMPEPRPFPGYQSDVIFERTAAWIEEQRGVAKASRRWFCVASIEPPHPPYDAVRRTGVREENLILSDNVPNDPDVQARSRRELAGYYAQIEATDAALGRLLARIDFSTTAVVFTSVHGDMHGAHGQFRKGWPHEESVRVPLLVRIPGQPASRSEDAFSLLDLPRATLALAREGNSEGFLQRREHAQISMPSVVNLPLQCDRIWRGVRSAKRKLVVNDGGSPWLFFDLEKDPGEMRNLAEDPSYAAEIAAWAKGIER